MKHPDSSDSAASNRKPRPPLQGLNQTSWSPSEASQSAFNVSYPTMVPTYPLYPPAAAAPPPASRPDPSLSSGFGEAQNAQAPPTTAPFPAPIVAPVVALVLPNYIFPPIAPVVPVAQLGAVPRPTFFTEQTQTQPAYPAQQPFQTPQPAYPLPAQPAFTGPQPFPVQTAFSAQQPFQAAPTPYTTQQAFCGQPSFPVQAQFVPQAPYPAQPFPYGIAPELPKAPAPEPREGAASRSSTPASGAREPATSPPLFESRCSSPLQLNLLSMEEGQRPPDRQDGTAPPAGGQCGVAGEQNGGAAPSDRQVRATNRRLRVFKRAATREKSVKNGAPVVFSWSPEETGTRRPATCWTSCCRSRRTPTPAPGQPRLAPWGPAWGPAPTRPQPVEPQVS